jgi:osmotically-inducible protein OsmY
MTKKLIAVLLFSAAIPALQGCAPLAVGAAAGGAVLMIDDRRTAGVYIEDENIEWKVLARVREVSSNAHVNATSYNRKVLLTGEAPTDVEKSKIEEAVKGVPSVREVVNEIQVAGASSFASRGSDSLVTSNVKARMVNNGKFSVNHVKVVTEGGTVFLMGMVTQVEGDAAAEIARTTSGVTRVVKVFEYIGSGK